MCSATVGDGVDVGAAVVQAVIVNQLFTIAVSVSSTVHTTRASLLCDYRIHILLWCCAVQSLPGADYIDPTTFTLTITNLCDANAQLVGDQCGE